MLTLSGAGQPQNGGAGIEERFVISVKTDNAGGSADNQFTLPTAGDGYNYDIETSDGQTITGNTGNTTITFPSAGEYQLKISGSFPRCYFNDGGDKQKLLDIKNFGIYGLGSTSQAYAFRGCSNMVITATDVGHFGDVTSFFRTWASCSSLTFFPLIDTSSAVSLQQAWVGCSSLISFPLIDTGNVTSMSVAWENCSSLTSFPLIETGNVDNFERAWWNCVALTSFPAIDTNSGTKFNGTWMQCSNLVSFPLLDFSSATIFSTNYYAAWRSCNSLENFPSNAFDTTSSPFYANAFQSTNLNTQSIDGILASIDTSGTINGTFTQSGGQGPSYVGSAAISSLVAKGWTIVTVAPVASPEFAIQVKTDNTGTSNDDQFTLPWIGTYDIDWGDGVVEAGVVDTQTHTYASAGNYDISITATTGQIYFARANNDRRKLLDIKNWGSCEWTTMERAFHGCERLEGVSAMDVPNLTNCTNTGSMFALCCYYTSGKILNLINWDVSNVTYMNSMFDGFKRYNSISTETYMDFSNWDFSNVTTLRQFASNSPIVWGIMDCTNIDLSNLTSAYYALDRVVISNVGSLTLGEYFPQMGSFADDTLNNLDITGVYNFYTGLSNNNLPNGINFNNFNFNNAGRRVQLRAFLAGATNIPDITQLDVSNVESMQDLFNTASAFNQDISGWDVSNVTNMKYMFHRASSFDKSLANWDIANVQSFTNFMAGAELSRSNYDATLIGWAAQDVKLNMNVHFGSSKYTVGGPVEAARNTLINTYGWTIIDGGGILSPLNGLVASYSFDTDFSDYTGNNNLTASGNATAGVVIGKVDKCADFDGSGDYALAVDSDDFSMTNGTNDLPFSVSVWIKLDVIPTANKNIVAKEQSGQSREWVILYSPYTINGIQFTIRNAAGSEYINLIDNTITYQTNTWYHFTFTYNGNELGSGLKCYRDGALQSLNPVVVNYTGMTNTPSPFTIGGLSNTKWTNGQIDEVHVWKNRELTAAEALEIYNTENAGSSILP